MSWALLEYVETLCLSKTIAANLVRQQAFSLWTNIKEYSEL
jgi:hypothetical protein